MALIKMITIWIMELLQNLREKKLKEENLPSLSQNYHLDSQSLRIKAYLNKELMETTWIPIKLMILIKIDVLWYKDWKEFSQSRLIRNRMKKHFEDRYLKVLLKILLSSYIINRKQFLMIMMLKNKRRKSKNLTGQEWARTFKFLLNHYQPASKVKSRKKVKYHLNNLV